MSSSRSLLRALSIVVIGWLGAALLTAPSAHAADRDCGDFATQKAAQIFFLKNGGPRRDPHRLDSEGDGLACESNPCPCYYGKKLPDGNGGGGNGGGNDGGRSQRIVQHARIVKVVDGDTVDVRLGARRVVRVRMIGINTPERGRCGYDRATRSLAGAAPRGTRVKLVSDRTQDVRDRYGRILRYVTKSATGTDLNRQQVARGWARVYVYDRKPFERVRGYRKAARSAKAHRRGTFRSCR